MVRHLVAYLALRHQPNSEVIRLAEAVRQENWTVVCEEGDKILTKAPNFDAIGHTVSEARFRKSQIYVKQANWDDAIKEVSHALRLNNTDSRLYAQQGLLHFFRGDHEASEESLRTAEQYGFQHEVLSLFHVLNYTFMYQYDRASTIIDRYMKLYPNESVLYFIRGLFWLLRKDRHKATDDFDKAVELDPEILPDDMKTFSNWLKERGFFKDIGRDIVVSITGGLASSILTLVSDLLLKAHRLEHFFRFGIMLAKDLELSGDKAGQLESMRSIPEGKEPKLLPAPATIVSIE